MNDESNANQMVWLYFGGWRDRLHPDRWKSLRLSVGAATSRQHWLGLPSTLDSVFGHECGEMREEAYIAVMCEGIPFGPIIHRAYNTGDGWFYVSGEFADPRVEMALKVEALLSVRQDRIEEDQRQTA